MTRSIAARPRKTHRAVAAVLGLVVCLAACQPRAATTPGPEVVAGSGAGSAATPPPAPPPPLPAAAAGSAADALPEPKPAWVIRYAAKAAATDYFAIHEDEQTFFLASWDATGGAATKRAAEAFEELYRKTVDLDATWPYPMDRKLSYIENRLVCAMKWANAALHAAAGRPRAMAVAAIVSGDDVSIAQVGKDRAYLLRDGQLRQLTRDHTLLEEYRRDHPDAPPGELGRLPRKDVLTRALGRRDSVEVDLATEHVRDGDRLLLASEALYRALDERAITAALLGHGFEKEALEAVIRDLGARAARTGGPEPTMLLLAFVVKPR